MEFVMFFGCLILAGLFVSYLIDAIRSSDEAVANDKRGKACASFVGLVALMLLFIGG